MLAGGKNSAQTGLSSWLSIWPAMVEETQIWKHKLEEGKPFLFDGVGTLMLKAAVCLGDSAVLKVSNTAFFDPMLRSVHTNIVSGPAFVVHDWARLD